MLGGGEFAVTTPKRVPLGGGVVGVVRGTVRGTADVAGARGVLDVRADIRTIAEGKLLDRCVARQAWTAVRRPGVVFAGATTQHEPIVLELAADHRAVRLWAGWEIPCGDDPIWTGYDAFGGRLFGIGPDGTVRASYEEGIGGRTRHVVDLEGAVAGERIAGWLFLQRITSGGGFICDTGRVGWDVVTG
jgi:hypothetical protein